MTSSAEDDEPTKYWGLEIGTVTNDADPKGLGRVKIHVPGIVDETQWAFPLGTSGGGGPQRGFFSVPPVGSDVGVFFHRGDPGGQPYYLAGAWGEPAAGSEVPTPVRDVEDKSEAHRVKAFETARWLVTYDDREGKELLRLEDKESACSVEMDGKKLAVSIHAETSLSVRSGGILDLDADLEIQIGGRKVIKNGRPI